MGQQIGPEQRTYPVVLVVEDEPIVRLAITAYLRDLGWKVLEATNAEEARQILLVSQPIDIVFADAQVPGTLDGIELTLWIRRRFPEVLIILTSDDTGIIQGLRASGAAPLVIKPYAPQDVAHRIADLLNETAHPPPDPAAISPQGDRLGTSA
jgi:CheY-like chemotaxis protein